ncbi:serine hydrolase domain-containing protein [Paenibacillus sp. IHBB 10380]|uniref:serine hydrolase domain-containing protein n=1 Tax=Paenibacillus sp. IHBB 10380 TaxID=1566358 RepID=UPI0005CFB2D8|nr:serine hydrolase domain-containing protein [Paenibacillus sp. IHBB 10380]AJS58463.1 beta-lactamase [Paenibacillus sp. IHBB 10380]
MKRGLTAVLALSVVFTMLSSTAAKAASNKEHLFEKTKTVAAEKAALLTSSYGTNSVQYALIDHGSMIVSGHTGKNDAEGKQALTADTIYGIGSTSKMFVTAAVMKLVDEGKLNLDTPVTAYISDFKMKDERYKKITPRMLLNHSSGLSGATMGNTMLFGDNDTLAHDTLLQQLAAQSLKADPGAFSVYCNDGFTLAEILVERASGESFTSYIHKYFTEPLGMDNTKTPQEQVEPRKMAGLYYPTYPGQLPKDTVNVIGSGGIYSTAEDVAKFSQVFTGQVKGIVSDSSIQAMEQKEYKKGLWTDEADSSIAYGLGWDSVNLFPFTDYRIQALTKGGDTILYHSSLVVLPEYNMAAVVLSSGGSSQYNQVMANEMLISALQEKGIITELKPQKSYGEPMKAKMPKEVAKHAGAYGSYNALMKVDISSEGEMTISMLNMPSYPVEKYTYTADGSFVKADGSAKISVVTANNGRTYLWNRAYITMPGIGQTALSQYSAEKLEVNELSTEAAAAWSEREGKKYYEVNEKYTSQLYFVMQPSYQVATAKEAPGYLVNRKITGANTAVSELHIPLLGGRDAMQYNFYTKDGVEYLDVAGSLYVREEAVQPFYVGIQSKATIPENGLAKWYAIPTEAAGKTMKVTMPEKGAFAVYNEQGACVNYTVVSKQHEVALPQNGMIVFAGESGAEFHIALQ